MYNQESDAQIKAREKEFDEYSKTILAKGYSQSYIDDFAKLVGKLPRELKAVVDGNTENFKKQFAAL